VPLGRISISSQRKLAYLSRLIQSIDKIMLIMSHVKTNSKASALDDTRASLAVTFYSIKILREMINDV
jgi:hypothetical protein